MKKYITPQTEIITLQPQMSILQMESASGGMNQEESL